MSNFVGIIATGYREPKVLIFAFSEYKRALEPNGDSVDQTLGAMWVGQTLNHNQQPLYDSKRSPLPVGRACRSQLPLRQAQGAERLPMTCEPMPADLRLTNRNCNDMTERFNL